MWFFNEADYKIEQWKLELIRARQAHEHLVFWTSIAAAVLVALALVMAWRHRQRLAAMWGRLPASLVRDLRLFLVIAAAVLAALLAWSAIR